MSALPAEHGAGRLGAKSPLREAHNANLSPVLIRDFKRPLLKTAFVPMAAIQHITRDHSGVSPGFFISGEFIAIRIGNRFPLAHNDIEKISRHS
jgi:hypothetical protein